MSWTDQDSPQVQTDAAPAETGLDPAEVLRQRGPMLLRGLGMLAVIAGFCAYLLESWELWNGVNRFYVMEAVALILGAAGFGMSYLLKENKGARSFFALSLIASLTFTTTLAGFVYSALGLGAPESGSALLLIQDWRITGVGSLLLMLVTAVAILVPIAWFAFRIFNRPHASRLLLAFVATSALLLVPVRESFAIGAVIVLAIAIPVLTLWRVVRGNPQFRTLEGRFSASVLFAPAVIMLGRLFWLYEADAVIFWLLSAGLFAASRLLVASLDKDTLAVRLLNALSMFLAMAVALISADLGEPVLANALIAPVAALIFWAMLQAVHRQSHQSGSFYGPIGDTILAIVITLNGGSVESLLAAAISVMIAGLFAVKAYREQSGMQALFAVATLLSGTLPYVLDLLALVNFTNWITLGVIGALAIVAASVLERFRRKTA